MIMPPRVRKLVLAVHLIFAVGWIIHANWHVLSLLLRVLEPGARLPKNSAWAMT